MWQMKKDQSQLTLMILLQRIRATSTTHSKMRDLRVKSKVHKWISNKSSISSNYRVAKVPITFRTYNLWKIRSWLQPKTVFRKIRIWLLVYLRRRSVNVKLDQPHQREQTSNKTCRRRVSVGSMITTRLRVRIKSWINSKIPKCIIQVPTFRSKSSKALTISVVLEERSMEHLDLTRTICTQMHLPLSSRKVSNKCWLKARKQ